MSRIRQKKQGVINSLVWTQQDNRVASIAYDGTDFDISAPVTIAGTLTVTGTITGAVTGTTLTGTTVVTNTVSEGTLNTGVTVDGVLLRDGYFTGRCFCTQGAPVNSNVDPADKSVFAAGMLSGLLTATPAGAINYTLPTGTQMDAADAHLAVDQAFDFSIINIGAGGIITFVQASGFTIIGTATVAANTSARFRVRKTAANTFVLYRL